MVAARFDRRRRARALHRKAPPLYAQAVVTNIVRSTAKLADFPQTGRIVPELNHTDFRELFVYSYRVIYRIAADTVTVIAVIHGKRLLPAL